MKRLLRWTSVVAVGTALTACGSDGGGSSGSEDESIAGARFAATDYRSAYIIGDTKDDGSPIASNADTGFNNPSDIAVSQDHFFVADRNNDRISKFDLSGSFVAKWPVTLEPRGVAVGPSGILHVAHFANNVVGKYRTDGSFTGLKYGPGGSESFYGAAAGPNYLYVADAKSHRILRFDFFNGLSSGAWIGGKDSGWQTGTYVYRFAPASGSDNGYFTDPRGVAVDPERGYLYVADTKNDRIQKFDLSNGKFLEAWGEDGNDQPPDFVWPKDVAVDPNGNVYVVDIADHVQKFTQDGTFVASFGASGSGTGEMRAPSGIAVDDNGNLYVTEDTPNHRVQKFAPVSGSEAAIAGDTSGKIGPGAAATVGAGTAETAAVGMLQNKGTISQTQGVAMPMAIANGPAISHYVGTAVDANGYRRIKMWIGPNGNIIPTGTWRDAHGNYCSQGKALKGAVNLLNIKVYPVGDGYFAFAQYIDVATGKILEQREGEDSDLQDAINQAWNNLNTPVGGPANPCEKVDPDYRFRFKTKFSQELTTDTGIVRTDKQEIVASDKLTYDDQAGHFKGSATLSWKTHYLNTTNLSYVKCSPPSSGTVEIIYPADKDGKPDVSGSAKIKFVNVTPECADKDSLDTLLDDQLSHEIPFYWEQRHEKEHDSGTTFTIDAWQTAPDMDSIVAQKLYDFTDTYTFDLSGSGGWTVVYSEDTTIRILK